MLTVLLAGTVVAGVFIYGRQQEARSIDPETLCPRGREPIRTAILIDASDPLTAEQLDRLTDELDKVIGQLRKHEWLGIYVLDEQRQSVPAPAIGKCHPGGSDDANPLYQNPAHLERALQRDFTQPLAAALREVASAPAAQETSPLLEMIGGVAADGSWRVGGPRRLVIVSDMLHNTPEYSHYRSEPDFAAFLELPYAEQFLDRNLANAQVEILHVRRQRDAERHTRRYITFWEDYFAAVGAQLVRVQAL